MNYPPIFETCAADSAVVGLLSESGGGLRLYPAGAAPQDVTAPYVTWQTVGGGPENYLGGRPDLDRFALQVDVWASTLSTAREAADAVEAALETVAHVTAFRGEEKDTETSLYRVGFDLEWFVGRASPEPAPVSSSSSQSEQNYPLDDDGTAAAAFGYGHMTTNAPAHLRADYDYTGAADGGTAVATAALANAFTTQAITVDAGTVLACEAVIHSAPSAFGGLGIAFFEVIDGTPNESYYVAAIRNTDGGTPVYYASGATAAARTSASAGFRVGFSINGDTGEIKAHTTDGVLVSEQTFTAGRQVGFYLFAVDDADPDVTGQSCSIELVPAAADMVLAYPAGAVDVFGNPV